jgi:hypothetical protein
MTNQEAKQILLLYRPGAGDEKDPEVAEAIALASRDPELQSWFEQHCKFQQALRDKLRSLPVPSGLRESILAQRKVVKPAVWWQSPIALAAAAVAVLLLAVAALWKPSGEPYVFSNFQSRMVGSALRGYRMDIETNKMEVVRGFLASKGAPSDYTITAGLAKLEVAGGGALRWRSNPVSMVCFKSGTNMLYLFVMNRAAVQDPPIKGPQAGTLRGLATVSWTAGENAYFLAGPDEPNFSRKYL